MTLDPEPSAAMAVRPIPSMCSRFVEALDIDGASIAVFGLGGHQLTICTTDSVANRLETLQFELGEGPHWDVLRTGTPVLLPNLAVGNQTPWPVFADSARALGIAALFAFPMTIGAAIIGAVDLYCLTPRRLDAHQVSLASSMSGRIASAAVRMARDMADQTATIETEAMPALRREVHQATGMIQAQLNTTATDAFARLRAHAFSTGRPVAQVAQAVVTKSLDFSTLLD